MSPATRCTTTKAGDRAVIKNRKDEAATAKSSAWAHGEGCTKKRPRSAPRTLTMQFVVSARSSTGRSKAVVLWLRWPVVSTRVPSPRTIRRSNVVCRFTDVRFVLLQASVVQDPEADRHALAESHMHPYHPISSHEPQAGTTSVVVDTCTCKEKSTSPCLQSCS